MESDDAKILLGFSPDSAPCNSQIKSAYTRKVWETHPDRFQIGLRSLHFVELSRSKLRANTRICSHVGIEEEFQHCCYKQNAEAAASYNSSYSSRVRVVRRSGGVPSSKGGHGMRAVASLPFLLIISAALALGGSTAFRAYRRQKEAHPCFNPFLP